MTGSDSHPSVTTSWTVTQTAVWGHTICIISFIGTTYLDGGVGRFKKRFHAHVYIFIKTV